MDHATPPNAKTDRPGPVAPRDLPKYWGAWSGGQGSIIWFAVKFVGLLFLFELVSFAPLFDQILSAYLHATAALANTLVHWCGEKSELTGASLWSLKYSVTVTDACSALEFAGFLGAAVLAFPVPWLSKVPGLAGGLILLGTLNVLRVASLYVCGLHGLKALAILHEDAWPALLVVATVGGVSTWIAWALGRHSLREDARA